MTKEKLEEYCIDKGIEITINEGVLSCKNDSLRLKIVENETLLNDKFQFLPELLEVENGDFDGWVYSFAGRWYYHLRGEEVKMEEFIYIGSVKKSLPTHSFLGIHSGYEMMNGVGLYKDYIKKAKFLGITSLGICEKNTLSGVLDFQQQCLKNDIRPIIGLSLSVRSKDKTFLLKLYAKNFQGWSNLLKFNSAINVDQELAVELDFVRENREDLFIIADPKTTPFHLVPDFVDYYQLDTVKYENYDFDAKYLDNLELYLKSDIAPISITDSYCLEPEHNVFREALWQINNVYEVQSENQYMKSKQQYAIELKSMFENDVWKKLFKKAVENEKHVSVNCNFIYDTNTRHLPKYIMTEDESKQFLNNEDLFLHLVKKGFKERGIKNASKYIKRLKKEIAVLKMGDVIDYFLSLHDILTYAHKEKLLTGIGRGCFVAGSKVRMSDNTYKNIEDVVVGDKVFNFFHDIAEVLETHVYDIEEEIVELDFGKVKITCTKDHKILTKNRGWVEADKLTEHDEVVGYNDNKFLNIKNKIVFNNEVKK